MDAVTEVLLQRSDAADSVSRMVGLSLAAHVVVIAMITLVPFGRSASDDNAHVMTISLAGAPGPVQGRNPMAAKPVQEAVKAPDIPTTQAPPALAKPEMIEPLKIAKPQPRAPAKPDIQKVEPQLHGRTPTRGAEVTEGKARVDTQSAIPFGSGLATGGGGAGAAYTDYADFCCPDYIQTMTRLIRQNWNPKIGAVGTNKLKFAIQRDGSITDIAVETSAGQFLDLASQRALVQTRQLPPLPAAFTHDRLTVHLEFEYQR